jgi:hypothetical protein
MSTWLSLSIETRAKLREIFSIPRSGVTQVEDQRVISDGVKVEDLMTLTVEKLQAFVASEETDLYKLFDLALIKIANPESSLKEQVTLEAQVALEAQVTVLEGVKPQTPEELIAFKKTNVKKNK